MAAHELPDKISAQLLELTDRLDLVYGAIDLRRTPEGRYVFLEVNPAGEYRFAGNRTGQPVPQASGHKVGRGTVNPSRNSTLTRGVGPADSMCLIAERIGGWRC